MKTSTELDKIAPAMLAVSKNISPVMKNKAAHKYDYADLVAYCDELTPNLIDNDLVVMEGGGDDEYSNPEMVSCQLRIQHVSGQWIETGILRVKVNPAVRRDGSLVPLGPQDYMIVYSYLRRYLLMSAFMIPTVDKDAGNTVDDKPQNTPPSATGSPPSDGKPQGGGDRRISEGQGKFAYAVAIGYLGNTMGKKEAGEAAGRFANHLKNLPYDQAKSILDAISNKRSTKIGSDWVDEPKTPDYSPIDQWLSASGQPGGEGDAPGSAPPSDGFTATIERLMREKGLNQEQVLKHAQAVSGRDNLTTLRQLEFDNGIDEYGELVIRLEGLPHVDNDIPF
jgi:hypothetical protein